MSGPVIVVVGDSLLDRFVHGRLKACQDGCPAFQAAEVVTVPGGAANAANCLRHTDAHIVLLGPVADELNSIKSFSDRVDTSSAIWCAANPIKTRFLDDTTGRIVFRQDSESAMYGLSFSDVYDLRNETILFLKHLPKLDAIYVADYDKGFLDGNCIRLISQVGFERDVPVVIDPKRHPGCLYEGILKCNGDYMSRYHAEATNARAAIVTHGALLPTILGDEPVIFEESLPPVTCVNHVGAGDCFGVFAALSLTKGLSIAESARIAHAAGRVYVTHEHNRAPYPHEVARDRDPVWGKVLRASDLAALRQSVPGRIAFTNGCFRMPHAGHAWLLDWARRQADVLVVGINGDESLARLRPGQAFWPLPERVQVLAGMAAVDWLVPFTEPDPSAIISLLKPDVLIKGAEYRGQQVPGGNLVPKVLFAPDDHYSAHCTQLLAE